MFLALRWTLPCFAFILALAKRLRLCLSELLILPPTNFLYL
jgi:hypothetical protein